MEREISIHISNVKKFEEDFNSGKLFIEFEYEDIYAPGFEADPIVNCELPLKFPLCCEYHKSVANNVFSWFDKFPNCCDYHKRISKKIWFDKSKFNTLPSKIVKNIFYTTNFIHKNIDSDDWYEDVENYIEYICYSFGDPNFGVQLYMQYLMHYIKEIDSVKYNIPAAKKRRIIKLLQDYIRPVESHRDSFNILYDTFQKWLKSFPDLIMFRKLKNEFQRKLPMNIILYNSKYNPYSGLTKSKVRTNRLTIG